MSLDPRIVEIGFRLFVGASPSPVEVSRLAELYGSKQELVAHLLTRENASRENRSLVSALQDVAKRNYTGPRSSRIGFKDIERSASQYKQMSNAQADVIKAMERLNPMMNIAAQEKCSWTLQEAQRNGAPTEACIFPQYR